MRRLLTLLLFLVALPATVVTDLLLLARRTGRSMSGLAERLAGTYLEVLEATEGSGGLDAWLERLFVARYEAAEHVVVRLSLPAWQQLMLRQLADDAGESLAVTLAAVLGRTLRAALDAEAAAGLPAGWGQVLIGLYDEHAPLPAGRRRAA